MACSCGQKQYVATRPDGTKVEYATQLEAAAEAARTGGSWARK